MGWKLKLIATIVPIGLLWLGETSIQTIADRYDGACSDEWQKTSEFRSPDCDGIDSPLYLLHILTLLAAIGVCGSIAGLWYYTGSRSLPSK